MRLTKITALAAVATLATALAVAAPAQASSEFNGVVEAGEFGLYYSPGSSGIVWDMDFGSNFSGNVFPGTRIAVDNNTASYRNRDTTYWHVWTGASWTGSRGCIPMGYVGNASTTFRNKISSAEPNTWSEGGC